MLPDVFFVFIIINAWISQLVSLGIRLKIWIFLDAFVSSVTKRVLYACTCIKKKII